MGSNVLKDYECINHRYAIHRDKLNFAHYDSFSASASQVEAVALLIKTGRFVGFLPQHYAAPLVAQGQVSRGASGPDQHRHAVQSDPAPQHCAQSVGQGVCPGVGGGFKSLGLIVRRVEH